MGQLKELYACDVELKGKLITKYNNSGNIHNIFFPIVPQKDVNNLSGTFISDASDKYICFKIGLDKTMVDNTMNLMNIFIYDTKS